jgi:hypothetical protein
MDAATPLLFTKLDNTVQKITTSATPVPLQLCRAVVRRACASRVTCGWAFDGFLRFNDLIFFTTFA